MLIITNENLLDLENKVDVIVNILNIKVLSHYLPFKNRITKEIRKKAGKDPFKELQKKGLSKISEGVLTSSGNLNFKGIIHIIGLNKIEDSTLKDVKASIISINKIVTEHKIPSIAIPFIYNEDELDENDCMDLLRDELNQLSNNTDVYIVKQPYL